MDKYAGIDDVLVEVDESRPERVLAALQVLEGLRDRLRQAENAVVARQTDLDQGQAQLVEATTAASAALAEIGQCPTCGTEMRQEAAEGATP